MGNIQKEEDQNDRWTREIEDAHKSIGRVTRVNRILLAATWLISLIGAYSGGYFYRQVHEDHRQSADTWASSVRNSADFVGTHSGPFRSEESRFFESSLGVNPDPPENASEDLKASYRANVQKIVDQWADSLNQIIVNTERDLNHKHWQENKECVPAELQLALAANRRYLNLERVIIHNGYKLKQIATPSFLYSHDDRMYCSPLLGLPPTS